MAWGRGQTPVKSTSAGMTQKAYTTWISSQTNQEVSPPTEIEWEYRQEQTQAPHFGMETR